MKHPDILRHIKTGFEILITYQSENPKITLKYIK